MRMRIGLVDFEFLVNAAAKRSLGQHTPDCPLNHFGWVALEELFRRESRQSTGMERMAMVKLCRHLVPCEPNLLGIENDDKVPGVDIRGVPNLVLATQYM